MNRYTSGMLTTFKATIEHVNHTTSRATVRTHTMLVDRGTAKGGFDLGPAGGEYQLVALAAVSRATSSLRFARAKMR
jgi:hypothetical protein